MKAQITLTVAEGKRVIAKAIARMPEVKSALRKGKIVLKGGTTVSALAEELVGIPLRISGRVTPKGTKTARYDSPSPHSILISPGRVENIDNTIVDVAATLGEGDVVVIGANALDVYGQAALMAGAVLGGNPGRAISGIMAEGVKVIIAVGLEKLIPGTIAEAVKAAGRKSPSWSLGMTVGLIPLVGRVITEKEALTLLADVKCTVIGKGGLFGAEGATTMVVEGEAKELGKVFKLIKSLKGTSLSGDPKSLEECQRGSSRCAQHLACLYKEGKLD